MENFQPKPTGVKEKNLYVVHLDTPRIVILASIIIGIVTASFLLGMTLMKDDKPLRGGLAFNDYNLDDKNGIDIFSKEVPPLSDFTMNEGKEGTDFPGTGFSENSQNIKDDATALDISRSSVIADTKSDKSDILTGENIKEIIPPAKKEIKPVQKIAKKPKVEEKVKEKPAKAIVKNSTAINSTSQVKEVSRDIDNRKQPGGFSIQVASYDVLSRAEQEKHLLKSKLFDAYIDRSVVNGKNYFRVRIGPVSSKDKAFSLLQEIQTDNRYTGSYLVKD